MDGIYATTKGLRSVPYLVFANTSMDDTCALHLSYIIAIHHAPEQLLERVPQAKAGTSAQQLASYDTHTRCQGIIFLPNDTLSSPGLKALDLSEVERNSTTQIHADGNLDQDQTPPTKSGGSRPVSGPRTSPATMTLGSRRRGGGSASEDWTETEMAGIDTNELDRARSRVQGDALENAGLHSNDLWRVAIKTLTFCRLIQPQNSREMILPFPSVSPLNTAMLSELTINELSGQPRSKTPIVRTLEIPGYAQKQPKSPTPASTKPIECSSPRQGHKRNRSSLTWTPESPTLRQSSPGPHISAQVEPWTTEGYRSNLPLGLPEEAWWRIMGYLAGADGILSEEQQKAVLEWAMDRDTLRMERDFRGKKDVLQIWKVLSGMQCLAYEKAR